MYVGTICLVNRIMGLPRLRGMHAVPPFNLSSVGRCLPDGKVIMLPENGAYYVSWLLLGTQWMINREMTSLCRETTLHLLVV